MKLVKNTLLTVSKLIAIAIGDLFSNGDRDRNFRDRGHALDSNTIWGQLLKNERFTDCAKSLIGCVPGDNWMDLI